MRASRLTCTKAGSFSEPEKKQHEIEFPNGSRIIALAANPDTARGYTGEIVLDEFAFHQDAEEIFKAAYGRMTNPGYQMRVVSTPNGAQGKFHALAQRMTLANGFRPEKQPIKGEWSAHWCDVHLAVQEGFPVNLVSCVPAAMRILGSRSIAASLLLAVPNGYHGICLSPTPTQTQAPRMNRLEATASMPGGTSRATATSRSYGFWSASVT